MLAIEDEERLYGQCEETEKPVVEGSKRRILASLAGLYLELPYRNVYSDAEWASCIFKVLYSKFGKCDSFTWTNVFVDATGVSVQA